MRDRNAFWSFIKKLVLQFHRFHYYTSFRLLDYPFFSFLQTNYWQQIRSWSCIILPDFFFFVRESFDCWKAVIDFNASGNINMGFAISPRLCMRDEGCGALKAREIFTATRPASEFVCAIGKRDSAYIIVSSAANEIEAALRFASNTAMRGVFISNRINIYLI